MHENKENQGEQFELLPFDPIVIVLDVLKRWYLIVFAAVFMGIAAYVVTDQLYTPEYTTTTTFVVSAQGNSTTVYQNLSATTSLATVFSEVLNSSILRDVVLEELEMTSFDGTISASAIDETNLLILQVTASDPRTAFEVTEAIIENHDVVTYQLLDDTILEVLQEPTVPTEPSNPISRLNYMKKAALVAAAAMCVLLVMLSYGQNAVRSKREAERKLDCRVLGEIRHEKKYKTIFSFLRRKKTGIVITHPTTSFYYLETIRKLRRKVEQKMPDGGHVLMVTSVAENEGKSTVAVNLALSLAQKHPRVLLIDCDLRRPACYKILQYPGSEIQIADIINGNTPFMDAVAHIEKDNLYVLLEQHGVPSSTELTSSDGMAQLVKEAREQFDFVILDTPPMSVAPDAECIAELADASLLVVQQNVVKAKAINRAIATLHAARSELVGCVVNNVYSLFSSRGAGYGYGYGYGYGRYGKYGRYGTTKKTD